MELDVILVAKLLALDEHSADCRDLILITRSLREQIGWEPLPERTAANLFARAFFALAGGPEAIPTTPAVRSG
ncbi:MAG TPA: hypothetical protein VFS64_04590 [Solirubrobacterales bacterium]|nr:hypothetical protein [Solirubrobacterales bacterium]